MTWHGVPQVKLVNKKQYLIITTITWCPINNADRASPEAGDFIFFHSNYFQVNTKIFLKFLFQLNIKRNYKTFCGVCQGFCFERLLSFIYLFTMWSPCDCVTKLCDNQIIKVLLRSRKSFKSIDFDLPKHVLVLTSTHPFTYPCIV